MHYLKITSTFLLTVHAFHLALLQESTDSPSPEFEHDWLRAIIKKIGGDTLQNRTEEEAQYDSSSESSNDYSGVASGSMLINEGEEGNVIRNDNNGSDVDTALPSTLLNSTANLPEESNTTVTITTTTTTTTTKQSLVNETETEEESSDSATTTQKPTTTSTTEPKEDTDLLSNTTTASPTTVTTPAIPMIPDLTTTMLPPETTGLIPETTPSAEVNTPEQVNRTALGDDEGRDFASDTSSSNSNRAWAAVLGTGLAVACVGLVAYIILKKKRERDFSHRKLVEEFHPDPVLRLDNSEPLDLNYGGGAYYNPALQRDNIQMSNFSGQRK